MEIIIINIFLSIFIYFIFWNLNGNLVKGFLGIKYFWYLYNLLSICRFIGVFVFIEGLLNLYVLKIMFVWLK